jgi:hypothetical protein
MDNVQGAIDAIRRLDSDRALLARKARMAAAFSRQHAFEDTFQRRVDHLASL